MAAGEIRILGGQQSPGEELNTAEASEQVLRAAVERDLYLMGRDFVSKRELRNPFHVRHDYHGIDPALDRLFDFIDSTSFRGDLPWVS